MNIPILWTVSMLVEQVQSGLIYKREARYILRWEMLALLDMNPSAGWDN